MEDLKEFIDEFIKAFKMEEDPQIWTVGMTFMLVICIFMLCGGACLISVMIKAFSFPMLILLIIGVISELYFLFTTALIGCVLATLLDMYPEE